MADLLDNQPRPAVIVPIRSLGPRHRDRIASHLLALDERDRYLRFGYKATDEQIRRYIERLDFDRDDVFGIYSRKLELLAMAHLAFMPQGAATSCAEFGVSVLGKARGRGFGSRLFDRAMIHARNLGVQTLCIHALAENTAMIRIARKAGASLQLTGGETDMLVRLPAATLDSHLSEMVEERLAQTDYGFKLRAKRFQDCLAVLQEARRGGREARRRSAP